ELRGQIHRARRLRPRSFAAPVGVALEPEVLHADHLGLADREGPAAAQGLAPQALDDLPLGLAARTARKHDERRRRPHGLPHVDPPTCDVWCISILANAARRGQIRANLPPRRRSALPRLCTSRGATAVTQRARVARSWHAARIAVARIPLFSVWSA